MLCLMRYDINPLPISPGDQCVLFVKATSHYAEGQPVGPKHRCGINVEACLAYSRVCLHTLPSLKHACSRGRPSLKAWLPMSKLCQDFKQPSNLEKSEGWVTGGWPGVIADHCNCWIIVVYSLNTEGYLFSVLPFCCLATEGWLHGKGLLVKQVFASPVSENTTERTSVGKGAARLKSWLCNTNCICILLQPCLWKESLYLPEVWWALKRHGLLCLRRCSHFYNWCIFCKCSNSMGTRRLIQIPDSRLEKERFF